MTEPQTLAWACYMIMKETEEPGKNSHGHVENMHVNIDSNLGSAVRQYTVPP